jgi:hypothetical protein
MQFKHQRLSVQSGDLVNHDNHDLDHDEVTHNDIHSPLHEEVQEEVSAEFSPFAMCVCA